ncbi:glucokinase [Sphingomonas sp. ASV193]|uniref:glucokinase n=1 Tax=Sphingomonas sp. ASV193 TaxID=3144405 RepID=UPI0032E90FA9
MTSTTGSQRVAVADIGGTHARFALATVEGGKVVELGEPVTLKTADHASLQTAWQEFGRTIGEPLPDAAGIAFAGPVEGEVLKLTNNPWVIRKALMKDRLGVERFVIVNDFAAVAHAVAQLDYDQFEHLCGPDQPFTTDGVLTVLGPGTGLGVGQVLREKGSYHVIPTEGGHVDFAPLDSLEDQILDFLRRSFRRVSIERVACGPGLANLYNAIAAIEDQPVRQVDDRTIWDAALAGADPLAVAALDRFFLILGAVAGDLALVHGANGVVVAGGLGYRLRERFRLSGFADRFAAKGRFERRMEAIPVKLITHPQAGLYGAAAAFAQEHA